MQISLDSLEIEKNEHDPFAQGQGGHPSAECSLGALQPAHGSLGAGFSASVEVGGSGCGCGCRASHARRSACPEGGGTY